MNGDWHDMLDKAMRDTEKYISSVDDDDYTESLKKLKDLMSHYGSNKDWLDNMVNGNPANPYAVPKTPSKTELTEKQKLWLENVYRNPHPAITDFQIDIIRLVLSNEEYDDNEKDILRDIREVYLKLKDDRRTDIQNV